MSRNPNRPTRHTARAKPTTMRIVGGTYRGRKLKYTGDPRVRPMKDRVRESLFNLLGPAVQGTFAIDLFGGTGALGLEAVSRGSTHGVIIERHLPTAKVIRENVASLDLLDRVQLITTDAFAWLNTQPSLPDTPWVIFVSPPYRFFTECCTQLLHLIGDFIDQAPDGSLLAVEATKEFDFGGLPHSTDWDVRSYPPAVIAVLVISDALRKNS